MASLSSAVCLSSQCISSSTESRNHLIGRYSGLAKTSFGLSSVEFDVKDKFHTRSMRVSAMGTQRFSTKQIGESKSRPKFGTLFAKAEEDDDEEVPSNKRLSLAINPATFSGLQFFSIGRKPDANTVFVANADGKTGSRIVLELLRDGFKVRAGVQDLKESQNLAKFASQYGIINSEEAKLLNVVEFIPDETEIIAKAIGNASKVILTIGESEDGPLSPVTPTDALQIVEAAILSKVPNLILVAKLSGSVAASDGPGGFFAKLFSFFTGKTGKSSISYNELLDAIVESDLKYTVFQTADSENISDTLSSTTELLIGPESASFGGKISKLQIASVVSTAVSNISVAENKVFEVSASSVAVATPIIELLSAVEEDNRRQILAEQYAKQAAEEEARLAAEEAFKATKEAEELEREARKLADEEDRATALAESARARADSVTASISELAEELKAAGGDVPRLGKASVKSKAADLKDVVDSAVANSGFSFNLPKFTVPKVEFPSPPVKKEVKKPASKLAEKLKSQRKARPVEKVDESPKPSLPKKKKGGLFSQEAVFVDPLPGDF